MELQKRIEILQNQYSKMLEYKLICNGINSTIIYSSIDFDREAMLLRKINETKDKANEQIN